MVSHMQNIVALQYLCEKSGVETNFWTRPPHDEPVTVCSKGLHGSTVLHLGNCSRGDKSWCDNVGSLAYKT